MARTLFLALAGLVVLAAVCDARECDSASNTQLSKDACADSTFLLDKYTTDITIGFDAHNLGEAPEDAGDELDAAGPLCYELDCIFSALVDGELKTKSAQWLSCDKETRDAFLECKADNDNVCGACKDEYLAAVNLPTDGYNFKRGVHEEGVFGRGYYWDPVTKMLVHDSHVASKSRDVDGNLALEFDLRDTVECTDDCPQTLIKPSIQSLLAGNVHEFDIDWKSHVRFSSAASRSDVRISYTINPCRTTITTCLFGIMVDEKVSWDSVFVQNIPPCASIDGITVEGIHLLGPGDHSAYLAYDCNNADVHINGNPGVSFSVLNPYHVGPNAESATLFANPQDF